MQKVFEGDLSYDGIWRAASAEGTIQIGLTQFDKSPCNIKTVQSTKFRKKKRKIFEKFLATSREILCVIFSKLATRFRPKGP